MPEIFNNTKTKLTTINITDCYQAPDIADNNRAIIISCLVTNVDGVNSADITMTLANSSNIELSKIANTIPIPADATLELIPNKLVLKRGEKLRATASAVNDLDVTISVLEIT